MIPSEYYQEQVQKNVIHPSAEQWQIIHYFDEMYFRLIKQQSRRFFWKKSVKGLYLWGSVGVGKTFLIDLFFDLLPVKKIRLHFHEFMLHIHEELKKLQGQKNPLNEVANKLKEQAEVIFFDEFLVRDIADAMLLAGLLEALFKKGVCLIATSNTAPDDLYKEGLQRESFLPAIALIKKYMQVFPLKIQHDYRTDYERNAEVYYTPLNQQAEQSMETAFDYFAGHHPVFTNTLWLFGRPIVIRKQTDSVVWFDFKEICNPPRSQKDYLEIAKRYQTVLISNIPVMMPDQCNSVMAFINLVDVLYDRKIHLVISAETDVDGLYPAGDLRTEFARTRSRLLEMQSKHYFSGDLGL